MPRVKLPMPISGGVMLSYKCPAACRHCMYACSPQWDADWITLKALEDLLTQLASRAFYTHLGDNFSQPLPIKAT